MHLVIAEKRAKELMFKHGLKDWRFRFNDRKRSLGICKYPYKVIELSRQFVINADEASVLDVILHEIAHALVGWDAAHGLVWQNKAREIGANPVARYEGHLSEPVGKYSGICNKCNKIHYMYRKPKFAVYRCKCHPKSKVVMSIQKLKEVIPGVLVVQ